MVLKFSPNLKFAMPLLLKHVFHKALLKISFRPLELSEALQLDDRNEEMRGWVSY